MSSCAKTISFIAGLVLFQWAPTGFAQEHPRAGSSQTAPEEPVANISTAGRQPAGRRAIANQYLPADSVRPSRNEVSSAQPASATKTLPVLVDGSETQLQPVCYVYDFSAKWCPSCHDLAPTVKQASLKYKDFARVISLDVDLPEPRQLARKLGLRAVPTLVILDRNGNTLRTLVGLQEGLQLDRVLNSYRRGKVSLPISP